MNFILVNGRTPCRHSVCALCGLAIGSSYLREMGTHLYYCNHGCYSEHCERVMDPVPHARLASLARVANPAEKQSKAELVRTT